MRKLTLDVDALQVETFDTETDAAARGTVVGAAITDGCEPVVVPFTQLCTGGRITCNTCFETCKATCDDPTCGYQSCFETGCPTCLLTCNPSCHWCLNP